MRSFNSKLTRHFSTLFSPARRPKSNPSSYIAEGKINYLRTSQQFPYYTPPTLPANPINAKNFVFNANPISATNPYGQVTEGCSHSVYRAKSTSGEIYYIKDLSASKLRERDNDEARFIAHQETFATWLMYQIFGPALIPKVFPVKFKDKWGLASSEIQHFGTLNQLALQLGHSDLEILYDKASALTVRNGQTFLLLTNGQKPIRVKGRIAFKIALHLLIAHHDIENSHKNIFMQLIPDPANFRQVACPGMFDFGCVFESTQMHEYISACENPDTKNALIQRLATNSVDAHIEELNVKDSETIEDRLSAKEAAYRRTGGLPLEQIMLGLEWFKQNAPADAHSFIEDKIKKYLLCTKDLALHVANDIGKQLQNEPPVIAYRR